LSFLTILAKFGEFCSLEVFETKNLAKNFKKNLSSNFTLQKTFVILLQLTKVIHTILDVKRAMP
ncbi:TPA: hypothetical protein ACGO0R_001751, partial [Streptococcus suis]